MDSEMNIEIKNCTIQGAMRAAAMLVRAAEITREEQAFVWTQDLPVRCEQVDRIDRLIDGACQILREMVDRDVPTVSGDGRPALMEVQQAAHQAAMALLDWTTNHNEQAIAAAIDALGVARAGSKQLRENVGDQRLKAASGQRG